MECRRKGDEPVTNITFLTGVLVPFEHCTGNAEREACDFYCFEPNSNTSPHKCIYGEKKGDSK